MDVASSKPQDDTFEGMALRLEVEWYKLVQLKAMHLLIPYHDSIHGATGEAEFADVMEEVVSPQSQALGRAILASVDDPDARLPEWRVSLVANQVVEAWLGVDKRKRGKKRSR